MRDSSITILKGVKIEKDLRATGLFSFDFDFFNLI